MPQKGIPLVAAALVAGLIVETLWPLRKATQPKLRRAAINLSLAIVGAAIVRAFFFPVVVGVSLEVEAQGWGLLAALRLPSGLERVAALLLLDYTLYVWHVANHHWNFLWRFHGVHHADLDMDVTTASRFHVGELALSAGYRSAQIVVFGIDPATLVLFETMVTLSAQFHHANLRLPFALERRLQWLFVTPRMHGVHHSIVRAETNSNYTAILTIWDRAHRTLRLNVPQSEITIGVPAYRSPEQVTLWRSLVRLPLESPPWILPDGTTPERAVTTHPTLASP